MFMWPKDDDAESLGSDDTVDPSSTEDSASILSVTCFSRAIEQLGSDNPVIRLGGIYTLEQIARQAPSSHQTVMDLLSAFVRECAPAEPMPSPRRRSPDRSMPNDSVAHPPEAAPSLRTDLQAILTVIGRRRTDHDLPGHRINLSRSHLVGLRLQHACLRDTCLEEACLRGVHFEGADLENVHLRGADLEGAHLGGAMLKRAHLEGTTFEGAYLEGANLQQAYLSNAFGARAYLDKAYLGQAYLRGANLDEAYLGHTYLENAYLEGASLDGAILQGAILKKACLREANLRGADLREANVDGADFWRADLSDAKLPDGEWLLTTFGSTHTLYGATLPQDAADALRDAHPHLFEPPPPPGNKPVADPT